MTKVSCNLIVVVHFRVGSCLRRMSCKDIAMENGRRVTRDTHGVTLRV